MTEIEKTNLFYWAVVGMPNDKRQTTTNNDKRQMQMIIWRGRYLGNDHPDGPASGGEGLLQMIIQRDRPFANDHPEGLASCKSTIESNIQCGAEKVFVAVFAFLHLRD